MKKGNSIVWGLILILAGVVVALNVLNVTDIDIFFEGWWTLFIIVPCAIGLFNKHDKIGNVIGLVIGICLFLGSRDILDFDLIWKLLVPFIIICIGFRMVFKGMLGNKGNEMINQLKQDGEQIKRGFAAFSGCDINCDNEAFEGAELTALFGGVECNLKHAVIEKDCVIRASAIFGGIDILVPDYVNVKINSNCLFGGIANETAFHPDAPTIYITGICLFGGMEIK